MTSVLILFNTTYGIALWLTGVYYSVNCNSEVFICMPLKLLKNISTICEVKKRTIFIQLPTAFHLLVTNLY